MRGGLIVIVAGLCAVACTQRPRVRATTAPAARPAEPIVVAVSAAWTAISGLRKIAAAGVIDGTDDCKSGSDLPAVAVPADVGYTGGSPLAVLRGGPPLIDTTLGHSARDLAQHVQVDWQRLINPTELAPDFTFPRDSGALHGASWAGQPPGTYVTVLIDNDTLPAHAYVLTGQGRGLVVAMGDLIMRGNETSWSGVLLVGGTLTIQGRVSIDGAVVTGLNVKRGYQVPVNRLSQMGRIGYNSCAVRAALTHMTIRRARP